MSRHEPTGERMSPDTKPPGPATVPPVPGRGLHRGVALVAGLTSLAVLVMGVLIVVHARHTTAPAAAPLPERGFSVTAGSLPALTAQVPAGSSSVAGPGPCSLTLGESRVVAPSLCVDGPIVPTDLEPDGALAIPHDVHTVGWWDKGAGLSTTGRGNTTGTTLLAGHVDYLGQGDGALYRLSRITPGAVLYTTDRAGTVTRWRAVSLRVVIKSELPADLFTGRSGPRRLIVVTCGGPIEHLPGYGNSYRDNVIVTAVPA